MGRGPTTRYELSGPDGTFLAEAVRKEDGYEVTVGARKYQVRLRPGPQPDRLVVETSHKPIMVTLRRTGGDRVELSFEGESFSYQRPSTMSRSPVQPAKVEVSKGMLASPMPGRVITVVATEGESTHEGEPLVVIESMKMEVAIRSDREAIVERILVTEGDSVKRGQAIVKFRD